MPSAGGRTARAEALRTQLGGHAGQNSLARRRRVHPTRAQGAWWAAGRPHSLRKAAGRRALTGELEAQRAQLGLLGLRRPCRAVPYAPGSDTKGLVASAAPLFAIRTTDASGRTGNIANADGGPCGPRQTFLPATYSDVAGTTGLRGSGAPQFVALPHGVRRYNGKHRERSWGPFRATAAFNARLAPTSGKGQRPRGRLCTAAEAAAAAAAAAATASDRIAAAGGEKGEHLQPLLLLLLLPLRR